MMGNQSKEERVGELALQKSQKIQLQNHKTGWNALRRLWGHPEHQKALRLMGYGAKYMYRLTSPTSTSIKRTAAKEPCPSSFPNGVV